MSLSCFLAVVEIHANKGRVAEAFRLRPGNLEVGRDGSVICGYGYGYSSGC